MPCHRYTPKDVLELQAPTESFLCPLSANKYGIEFLHFSISDFESKRKIFEIGKDRPGKATLKMELGHARGESAYRTIRYEFSEDVLRLPAIATELEFSVGSHEVHNLRMIERHYFRDEIVKSFDFNFGFCIPSSLNTWETIYALPPLDEKVISDMVAQPYATVSDSFYFVGDELIMHNKAEYKYIPEDRAQAKKSYDHSDDYDDAKGGAKEGSSRVEEKGSGFKSTGSCTKWSKEDDYE
ncbi:Photoreceptor synaptic vesicle protein HRG4/UNC-119 [Plasmopara halstedii]|uniref:Photoreceptor synaptic vesicle protein HRG4/UNC-119 n=1 Tax=Plasmopara halstedii TaxID=4781 RepID=A0A0P1AW27_PLAHL|nr:Photoreceptor synaptic vesicle protein HRG4/UNC-119 [Plasmopara halstedii]CEG45560.1 Photoreceptor synaptic vesicle protein HRG4/UNC-119 [Plasmopara halstedii]|eukprot:XP_024581929.1 Photoreceptor synaptic vesicle protein HRG4/UNC-119 [Plasmopara halstedii]